ncbi:CynX/NimT family MFS transporter [Pollutimonas thiosulfatoxidans]|uniref:Cyanate transporter n=1 Tax=Pollutimonas thiosulfatoxidans TaxID=2028345 RepID=A0A410GCU9_9BURK|nr:MFS transporter [Pollutimonas thiosulfatoxidans]MBF6616817.1 MFS transporter [Candidimonas sp.]QAA94128.1 cyanate transporter [Pollutimonas thiosulfatoxidans]
MNAPEERAQPLSSTPPSPSLAAMILLGLSLMLIAFNLRPLFASLSVLLPDIIGSTSLSSAGAGYLTTLPVLCLGLFAPLAPRISQRVGPERTLLAVLFFLTVGTAMRGMGGMAALFIGSALAGAAIATGNVLLPSVVKRDFPHQAALMTGLYTMALCGGAASAAAFTLPIAHFFDDSWAAGLVVWALPAALVLLIWAPQSLRSAHGSSQVRRNVTGLWRDPLAWQVTLFMGLQSALAYCLMGWLAPILRERGLEGVEAGLVVSVSIMVQVVTCLLVPPLAVRCRNQSLFNAALALTAASALIGLLFAPVSTVWIWAVLQGIGQGGLFAIAMTVIVLRSPDSHVAAHLSGMAQGVGYVLAALGPLLVGVLHSLTGSFASSGWLFAALGTGAAISGWGAGRTMYVKARSEEIGSAGRRA